MTIHFGPIYISFDEYPPYTGAISELLSALLPLCRLGGWASGGGGDSYPKNDSQSPGHQVEAVLLEDMWIRQE